MEVLNEEIIIQEPIAYKKINPTKWLVGFCGFVFLIIYYFYFKTIYMDFLKNYDPNFVYGYILKAPLGWLMFLKLLLFLIPKRKKLFAFLLGGIVFLVSIFSIKESLSFFEVMSWDRFWQENVSNVLILTIAIWVPTTTIKKSSTPLPIK